MMHVYVYSKETNMKMFTIKNAIAIESTPNCFHILQQNNVSLPLNKIVYKIVVYGF